MSRSYKKNPIYKDKGLKDIYWKTIRSHWKTVINSCKDLDELEIPAEKTIVNDYDYSDYTYIPWTEEMKKKFRRK